MLRETDVAPEIYEAYLRDFQKVGAEDPYASDHTLGIHDVLNAHFWIADFFYAKGKGIGGIGVKYWNGLHSALFRQQEIFGVSKWQSQYDICATLLYGLIMNHPFHDANKRTAFLASLLLLHKQGVILDIKHRKFEDFTVDIAERKLNMENLDSGNAEGRRIPRRKAKSRNATRDLDQEVRRISKFIKDSTRLEDTSLRSITFRQLEGKLRDFGFYFDNMKGNRIDVMQEGKKKRSFWVTRRGEPRRVTRIGFPGMSRQVSKGDLKRVLKATGLTAKEGFDSQVFFEGVDPAKELLEHYQHALRRLADR